MKKLKLDFLDKKKTQKKVEKLKRRLFLQVDGAACRYLVSFVSAFVYTGKPKNGS